MHPNFFGESRDITKRMVMRWLIGESWAAHPMWFYDRAEAPRDRAFLEQYAAALDVEIVDGESPERNELFEASQAHPRTWRYRAIDDCDGLLEAARMCRAHLLLDPDTGLGETIYRDRHCRDRVTHVAFGQFIGIVRSQSCQNKLTLIYDQGYSHSLNIQDLQVAVRAKLRYLREANIHAVAYVAEPSWKVCFIWASTTANAISEATQRMRDESGFPRCRFLDDGCEHV